MLSKLFFSMLIPSNNIHDREHAKSGKSLYVIQI